MSTPETLHGFAIDDLEAIADGLEAEPKHVNVGAVANEHDWLLESTTAAAARFIRATLAAHKTPPPTNPWSDLTHADHGPFEPSKRADEERRVADAT